MSTSLRGSNLIDNCTPSIAYDDQVQAACSAFDEQMYQILDDTKQVSFIPSILLLKNIKLIDILAWQFSVDFYDATRDIEFRKRLVQNSITWHMTKGTMALVQLVLDTYWHGGATIQEWYQYYDPLPPNYPADGWHKRYLFRISVDGTIITPDQEAQALELIALYKPVSRWCEGIIHPIVSMCDIGWAGGCLRFKSYDSNAPLDRHSIWGS